MTSPTPPFITFTTTLEGTGGRNVGVVVPDDVLATLGGGRRVAVVVTIDGGHTYRTTTGSMGGRVLVSFNAATREATGRGAGDEVEVTLAVDDAPRPIEVPPALAEALAADPARGVAFEALSPSKRRAHADAVAGAKTDETRARRVAKVLESLG